MRRLWMEVPLYIAMTAVLVACLYGWVMNIVKLFHFDEGTAQIVLRVLGLCFPPLGAVLGFV